MSVFFLQHPRETDLALFAGGESGPFARWRIERHVEGCSHCQALAAEYFRLPDQLNELADLPEVDWKNLSISIEAGVKRDAAAANGTGRAGLVPPLFWQAGLAASAIALGVVVVRQADSPVAEPEIAAVVTNAPAESTAPPPEQAVEVGTEAVADAELPQAAAAKETTPVRRELLVADVAAPPPPPPPPGARRQTRNRVAANEGQAPPSAPSAEQRLRTDAAARVGTVSVAEYSDLAAWSARTVEATNLPQAPIELSSGYSLVAGATAQTPRLTATNRSEKTISWFTLIWTAGSSQRLAATEFTWRGEPFVPGRSVITGEGMEQWAIPAGVEDAMRMQLRTVIFADGSSWTAAPLGKLPTPLQITPVAQRPSSVR